MFSILNRKGIGGKNIVQFLADTDEDLYRITDNCDPGSTVEVLEGAEEPAAEEPAAEQVKKSHTWIKSPTGRWAIYQGSSNFKPPVNDAEVSLPKEDDAALGGEDDAKKKISDYQRDIVIHDSGLVTGELLKAEHSQFGEEEKEGHFIMLQLKDIPEKAKQFTLSKSDGSTTGNFSLSDDNPDTDLVIRVDKFATATEPKKKTCQVKYDTGESCDLYLGDLKLDGGAIVKEE